MYMTSTVANTPAGLPLRELPRLAEIVRVAAAQGWSRYLERTGLAGPPAAADGEARVQARSDAQRLRAALEALGPTFVKFGQMLSVRADLFPDELVAELRRLQSEARPFDGAEARAIVERELGAGVETLFARFDEAPLAAASMAQVHRAWLRDGTEAVVKVQRPDIDETIASDLALLRYAARQLDRHVKQLQRYNLPGLAEEFAATIVAELDFAREAANAERFADANRDEPAVSVPRIFWDLTTRRVLTMELSHGRTIDEAAPADPAARGRLAAEVMRLFLTQVFEHGVFHADPHPGNVFLLADGRLCFHDFGQLGRLGARDQEHLRQLFLAVIARDAAWLADTYVAMGGVEGELDREAFVRDLGQALETYYAAGAPVASFGAILSQFVRLGRDHRVRLVREIALAAKAFMTVEALARALDSEFDSISAFRDYTGRLVATLLRPDAGAASLARGYRALAATRQAAAGVPIALARLLDELAGDGVALRVRHEALGGVERALALAANRLAFSLIVAAVSIGSAIVLSAHAGPHWEGLPLLGVAGFAVAAVLGVWWAAVTLRSGRL
jgi:ubiquinone biosynthesis protein